jgi:hypothetical protein
LCGCPPRPKPFPLEPVPIREAIRIVNENTRKIAGTLRASGSVDGHTTLPDGRSAGYHLDATLFFLSPKFVRFDLKSFGDRKFLLGSNAELYWVYDREADKYRCGRHGEDRHLPPEIPIPPEQIVDALGLTPIAASSSPTTRVDRVQRVVEEYQQILFLERNDDGSVRLQKEYWLDRYWPRLVRRVIFRDADGVVEMESRLDDYKPLGPAGPSLPHRMTAEWPKAAARLRFHVSKWRFEHAVGPDSIQFVAPQECIGD